MKAYFNALNERERWMLLSAALCIFIYIYYLFLYTPLATKVAQRKTLLRENSATLAWMNQVKKPRNTKTAQQSVNNSQLLTLLATQLQTDPNLKFPYQLQQTSSGEIQLTFEQVPFNLFIKWLIHINQQYVISIKQLNASKTNTPGFARLMIIISAA